MIKIKLMDSIELRQFHIPFSHAILDIIYYNNNINVWNIKRSLRVSFHHFMRKNESQISFPNENIELGTFANQLSSSEWR